MIGGAVLSAGVSMIGAKKKTEATVAQNKYQEQVATKNVERVEEQKVDIVQRGDTEEQDVLKVGAQVIGKTRGAYAANNMDLTFGTPLDEIIGVGMEVERDAYRANQNTKAAYGNAETEQENYRDQAGAYSLGASNAQSAGGIAMLSAAVGGATSVARTVGQIS